MKNHLDLLLLTQVSDYFGSRICWYVRHLLYFLFVQEANEYIQESLALSLANPNSFVVNLTSFRTEGGAKFEQF